MRPTILNPLFADARSLQGVGPKIEKLIAKAVGRSADAGPPRLIDLAFHLPFSLIDRTYKPRLIEAEPGRIATVTVNIIEHTPAARGSRRPYTVLATDDTGAIEIAFFNPHEEHIKRMLPRGSKRVVSGRIDSFGGRLQMPHPDFMVTVPDSDTIPPIEPVYRTTDGLTSRQLAKAVHGAVDRVPELEEWQDPAFAARHGWRSFADSVHAAHSPTLEADLAITTPARSRLAYDELLSNQLALMLIRDRMRKRKGRELKGHGRLRDKALSALPFKLTEPQTQAIDEIIADMASPARMLRLLQGDVGSGKTVVAMMALLNAVEAGTQGAFMAPTEILARQHMASLEPMAKAADVRLAILTGRERGPSRAQTLNDLEAGKIDIMVGTHALFSEDVAFRDLGLAVVDEQHRFGVHQRMQLQGKGEKPADVLVMTATPIPRTLQLTAYGEMEVSRLTGKPPGRQPVDTRVLPTSRLDEVIDALRRAMKSGARAYWVCPLVEESEKSDLAAAEERAAMLKSELGPRIGLVHGRMKGADRDAAMAAFKMGETQVLVATTVIEVGVDVPEASIMVVEHAERFGLAQLHQLRGRVGRGAARSTCLLVYQAPLGETAKARLEALRNTDDGFVIADEDLRLRGAGEVLGTKQSGLPDFHFADIAVHGELLSAARDDARLILHRDPELSSARGEALRNLLYIFERDEAVRYLRTG
jgi:ATP-dependent DNA helicase RecG